MLRLERFALAGLGLVLIVVVASAGIRLGAEGAAVGALRVAHRTAASAAVLIVIALAWLAWRSKQGGKAVALAAVLMAVLSIIGIIGGQNPPFAASMGNIVGGLMLAATFAWLGSASDRRPGVLLALLVAQAALGAWLSLLWRDSPMALLMAHALFGLALAVASAGLALRMRPSRLKLALFLLALIVPAAGIAAAFLDRALAPALAHASAAALLVVAVTLAPRLA